MSPTNSTKLAHYRAWTKAWFTVQPCTLPAEECSHVIAEDGPLLLRESDVTAAGFTERWSMLVACFKNAAIARVVLLGGKIPPSCDACDVMSENFDPQIHCTCSGLYPVSSTLSAADLESCGCKAIERMMAEGALVNDKQDEWNSSALFTSSDLSSAMMELALCHADTQPRPSSCRGEQDAAGWHEPQAPDRRPHPEFDLAEEVYTSLFPTQEPMRLSADAKHFFALVSGGSLVDPGIQMAIADSGNDILIGDYCDAATNDCLKSLQKVGAAAFSFLKLCVYAGLMTEWQFDQLVAQTIHFRVIGYWRDHALSRIPRGVYGSHMTRLGAHRHIDLGMAVGIVSASMATGQEMSREDYKDLVAATVLISDLVDFRGDTWRNQRENVILRGVRGSLCKYLDGLITDCITRAAIMTHRGKIFALMIMCFCNWMLLSSGHKLYEIVHQTQVVSENPPCEYQSEENGVYEQLVEALKVFGALGHNGPHIDMNRSELQLLYAKHRHAPDDHLMWLADVVRIVLHPSTLRRVVDVVHWQWKGELGDVGYCA